MSLIKTRYNDESAIFSLSSLLSQIIDKETIIICIGTDRCIKDSLGPIVGRMLQNSTFKNQVYGILGDTVNAVNLNEKLEYIKNIHPQSKIIAIDATTTKQEMVGLIEVRCGPVHPGRGVGKILPNVGDYSIYGMVSDINEGYKFFSEGESDVDFIVDMAETIALSLILAV
ncbi:spore protease YyaC [Romboutsia sp.]|uniref:spore protease YyaC n=1 Tax=Romboutsia sp. TaxID=1965302 RepID=UPI003F3609B9